MGKDLDDDAYSDSERGSVTIKGVTGGDFQIKTSIINVPQPANKQIKNLDFRQVLAITNLIKFKMEGSEFIKQILKKLDFATIPDLENAFLHVKDSKNLLPYFDFTLQGRLFKYSGLPF
ncbi:MAG: hypothetical protein EZS28_015098 [Streblomastix strix]|uniref:Uncharacterized protein n=1 Tax=Streblomastix strix TaxID=222440 RepID=A0A5J4W3L5_9EUKA|nr:MAG: hypothetical protein EZS28_015098 [Streblomastix strix]